MASRSRMQNRRLRGGGFPPFEHNECVAIRKSARRRRTTLSELNRAIRQLGRVTEVSAAQLLQFTATVEAHRIAHDALQTSMARENA